MLYRLWEDGKITSLDDPLEKYVENFTIKNPLGKSRDSELKYVTDGLIFLDSGEVQIRSSSVTLRRMASQLSGKIQTSYSAPPTWDWNSCHADLLKYYQVEQVMCLMYSATMLYSIILLLSKYTF
jgi:hypothetical protein